MPDKTFEFTEEDFRRSSGAMDGRCIECGAEAFSVEPDAREYFCEECETHNVYGLEELLMMGKVEIK